MKHSARILATLLVVIAVAPLSGEPQGASRGVSAEAATAKRFAAIRADPLSLFAFLREMPKGGDLHNHLSGSIYAESYLRWAAEDNLCLAAATLAGAVGVALLGLYLGWRAWRPRPQRGWGGWLTGGWARRSPRFCRWLTGDFIT